MQHLSFIQLPGDQAKSVVSSLYDEGRGISIRDEDLFLVAMSGERVIGSVRFCVEHGTPMLRTMRVSADYQGQKVGSQLLRHFEKYLLFHSIEDTFCLPYRYLEKFYSQIGFLLLDESEAPEFLRARLRANRESGLDLICMKRK